MKMMEARMHPVFTAHAEEVERLMTVNGGYMERYRARGETDSDDFRLMARVQRRCSELLMKLAAEDHDILLVDDRDFWWIRQICEFVRTVIDKEDADRAV